MPPQRRSTMVTIGVTKAPTARHPALIALKGCEIECDVESTWVQIFAKYANFNLDPNRYVVTSTGKQPVRADDKVRSLIGQFQKVLKKYSINIKEGRIPPLVGPVVPPAPANNHRRNGGATAAASSQRPKNTVGMPAPSSSSAASSATVRIPSSSRNKSPSKRPAVPAILTNGHHASASQVKYPEDDSTLFPSRDRDPFGKLLNDDDDTASQVTTDSQESQDDLIELGLANEDYKPKVVQRFMKNISNPQTIRIREELRKVMNDGKWNKVATKIPHASNFLMEVFRFQPVN